MARGVLLGRDEPRRRPEILVPPEYADEPQPIVGKCLQCGATFYRGEVTDWVNHLSECATEHLDEIRAEAPSEANKGTLFDPANEDHELQQHFRGVAERMKREGRTETRPNERAAL